MTTPLVHPRTDEAPSVDDATQPRRLWQTVVWDDPVNLMNYVTRVFRDYFGYRQDIAERLMLSVHNDGHAVVSEGPREHMELHAHAMHDYGLWATVREAPE